MTLDELYMNRCFELAMKGNNQVGNNPFVGAVIVHEGRIIGEGWHQKYGEAHGEVSAYNDVKEEDKKYLSESTIYVNLEPCFHHGKTPPCVDLILREKLKRVVISCLDHHPLVAGRSVQKLREHGVEVTTGILEKKGRFLARRFFTNVEKKRPYIILKYAQSEDGFIGQKGKQIWLTGPLVKRRVHKWRSEETAIMVGTNTAEVDNPNLTTRLHPGPNPIRIVLDRKARLENNLNIFNGEAKTIIISEKEIKHENIKHIILDFNGDFLNQLMKQLLEEKIKSIIIEGGAKLLNSFIRQNLWDEARIFTSSKVLGTGIPVPRILGIEKKSEEKIGEDRLCIYFNHDE